MAIILPRILLHLNRTRKVSVPTLAEWAEVEDKTMHGYLGGKDMPFRRARRVAQKARVFYDDTEMAKTLLLPEDEIVPRRIGHVNHRTDDDVANVCDAAAEARRMHRAQNRAAGLAAIEQLKNYVADLEAEILSLPH